MLKFVLRRTLWTIPTLFVVIVLTFMVLRIVPGGPFDSDRVLPEQIKENIRHKYQLDESISVQFVSYIKDVIRGDLGPSLQYENRMVSEIIAEALVPSLQLGFLALLLAAFWGLLAGLLAAARQNRMTDHVVMILTIGGISLPAYLSAVVQIIVFSTWLGWLPPAMWEGPASMILPAVTLSLFPAAVIARLVRSSALDVMKSDFIRTAKAKGLGRHAILFRHVVRNSLIPVVTMLGPLAASVVTGSFVVEHVFAIPGLGRHFVNAVLGRDYPLVMGLTIVYGITLIGFNTLVDMLYGLIDPRIRTEQMR